MSSHHGRVAALLVVALAACGGDDTHREGTSATPPANASAATVPPFTAPAGVQSMTVEIVEAVPHDPGAFTQGLVFDELGRLFESTGLEGESTLREVDPGSGEVLRSHRLDPSLFGEG